MRKPLLLCFVALTLAGCAPKEDPALRSREVRPYPDPTLGTDNGESQWYKTQILASPSAPSATAVSTQAGAAATNAPAKLGRTPVPTHTAAPGASQGSYPSTGGGANSAPSGTSSTPPGTA